MKAHAVPQTAKADLKSVQAWVMGGRGAAARLRSAVGARTCSMPGRGTLLQARTVKLGSADPPWQSDRVSTAES